MKKQPLAEGDTWIVANAWEPYDGYGTSVVDCINKVDGTGISFNTLNASQQIQQDDVLVAFGSKFENGSCSATFLRVRDLVLFEVHVCGASFWQY